MPSQVLSKKFTCMCSCESATLFLWNTIWLTFLRCLFITKLVMKYIWVTHTELTVGKLVWFLDCSATILVNIYFLELFLRIELFQSQSATHKCEPISIFIYYFSVHLVFTLIYAHYRELMSWSRVISRLLQACFLLGFSFLEAKICFLTLGKMLLLGAGWFCKIIQHTSSLH
jgi:uncharacterized protein YqhQ